jgi:vacuolar-type H+-ATPase subunit E/Vma4
MKEVVNEILVTEKECERILQDARSEALTIRRDSEKEAAAIISAAHEEAQKTLQEAVSEARETAQKERAQSLAETATYKRTLLERHGKTIDSLVDEISALVMFSPARKEQYDR